MRLLQSSLFLFAFLVIHLALSLNARPHTAFQLNSHLQSLFRVERFSQIGSMKTYFEVSRGLQQILFRLKFSSIYYQTSSDEQRCIFFSLLCRCGRRGTHFFLYKQPLFLAEAGRACKNLNFEPQPCLARA